MINVILIPFSAFFLGDISNFMVAGFYLKCIYFQWIMNFHFCEINNFSWPEFTRGLFIDLTEEYKFE